MKAVLSKVAGGPESLVIEDLPDPVPGKGQVRIRVSACALNYPDTLIIQDLYQFKPERPFAPGGEVAGLVDAVGEGVDDFRIGDRVIGWCWWGGLVQSLVIDADRCIAVPDAMPLDDAAALLLTYGTAHYALRQRAGLKAGDTVLVLGAAGGVGLAAVELAHAWGARVIAAASSQEKVGYARSHGADDGVVYPTGRLDKEAAKAFSDALKDKLGKRGADVVLDAVGGDYAEPALRAIAWEGRYLVVGFPAGIPKLPLNLILLKGCQVIGVFWGEWVMRNRKDFNESVADLLALYAKGLIKPRISQRFPMERAGEALRMLSDRKALGKILVTME
ncbi:MAG: NADPH:quinone oxidoreductase [Ramlibacter sp.]|nr:NADPH:quinone oxidoreductase [Ramlibacter sp.]